MAVSRERHEFTRFLVSVLKRISVEYYWLTWQSACLQTRWLWVQAQQLSLCVPSQNMYLSPPWATWVPPIHHLCNMWVIAWPSLQCGYPPDTPVTSPRYHAGNPLKDCKILHISPSFEADWVLQISRFEQFVISMLRDFLPAMRLANPVCLSTSSRF